MNKTVGILIALVVVGVLGVGAYALTSNDDSQDNAEVDSSATNQVTVGEASESESMEAIEKSGDSDDTMMKDADMTIDLSLKNFEFSRDTINAAPGDTVTVNLSVESGSHDFVIDELNVQSKTIAGSDTDSVTFTIPEDAAGQTFAFYCSIGSHRSQGMEGQLVIAVN